MSSSCGSDVSGVSGLSLMVGSEGVVLAVLVVVGGTESGGGEAVVVHGSHLGMESSSHHGVSPLVVSDGLLVLSDFPSVGSVPSEEESVGGSGAVFGVEVSMGFDEPGADE